MEILTTQDFMREIAGKLARNGFKMKDLSEHSGVSNATLSLASRGKSDLRFETARRISFATDEMIEAAK